MRDPYKNGNTMSKKRFTAIVITSRKIVKMLETLDPTLKELDYKRDLKNHVIVMDFPKKGKYVICTEETFLDSFWYKSKGPVIFSMRVSRSK